MRLARRHASNDKKIFQMDKILLVLTKLMSSVTSTVKPLSKSSFSVINFFGILISCDRDVPKIRSIIVCRNLSRQASCTAQSNSMSRRFSANNDAAALVWKIPFNAVFNSSYIFRIFISATSCERIQSHVEKALTSLYTMKIPNCVLQICL